MTPDALLPYPHCPSSSAGGRQDRCGMFSHPPRCTAALCSQRDAHAVTPPPFEDEAALIRRLGYSPAAARALIVDKSAEAAELTTVTTWLRDHLEHEDARLYRLEADVREMRRRLAADGLEEGE